MRLRLTRLQKIISEEITRAIKERDDKGTVTHYGWSFIGEGADGDDIIIKLEDGPNKFTLHGDGRVKLVYKFQNQPEVSKIIEWKDFVNLPEADWLDDDNAELKLVEWEEEGDKTITVDNWQKIIDTAKEHQGGEGSEGDSSDDTGDDDYQWDDEKLKFDLDVHDLGQAPSLFTRGDNVVLETDEYDIDIPKKVFKAFAAKL